MKMSEMLVARSRGKKQVFCSHLNYETPPFFSLSKFLLECTTRTNNKRDPVISIVRLDFHLSLKAGLIVRAHFLNSGSGLINLEPRPN